MKFQDFTTLTIRSSTKITPLQYQITPGDANVWKVYFTDDSSVVLGILEMNSKTTAHLTIYNSGQDSSPSELNLQKLNSQ